MKHDIKVGQQVYVVKPKRSRFDQESNDYETVTKVGNKYFYIGENYSQMKFDLETLREVGETNYLCSAYLTEEEYAAEKDLTNAWREFKSITNNLYSVPKHLTLEKLNVLNSILEGES